MKTKVKFFSDEFKMKIVHEYLNSDLSQKELLEKYSIAGASNITNWMRKFGFETPLGQTTRRQHHATTMSKSDKKTPQELALEAKIQELEKNLKFEKLRSLALDTMIDVAEEQLKISIRKKPGTKQ